MFGTNTPSIISIWNQSAALRLISSISSPRREKSADSTEGASKCFMPLCFFCLGMFRFWDQCLSGKLQLTLLVNIQQLNRDLLSYFKNAVHTFKASPFNFRDVQQPVFSR